MEDLRLSSRRAADRRGPAGGGGRSGYDDVFGGPPRYNSGPFAARMADYAEVFGGLSSACSIPVLDLPSALDGYGDAPADGLDYAEIFGGGGAGDFAFSYEELLAERDGAGRGAGVPVSTERAPKEAEFGEYVTEVLEFSPDGTDGDNMMFIEGDQVPYDSLHLNDGSRKLNTSHYKISRENMEETVTDTVHETQLRAVPGFSIDVAENSSLTNLRSESPSSMADNDLGHNAGSNGRVSEWKQEKVSSSCSSNASAKIPRNNNVTDQGSATKSSTSEDDPASLKHHSSSPSCQSASSGDTYYSDFSYLTVSDISLRTQPVRVPPPSRRPPKLVNSQEIPRTEFYANPKAVPDEGSKPVVNHQKQGGQDAPKRRAPHVSMRDSSRFYDVEVDASSAAAASAAAMKEAMEQAQARLKSAKELMERKQDIFQNRKKQGQKDGTRKKDGNDDNEAREIKIFNKVTTKKTLAEDTKKNGFVLPESQNTRVAAKASPDHEEKGTHILSDKHGQRFVEGNESKSSQASFKMMEKSGEWKTDKQFFELVHNGSIFQLVKERPDQEYKIPKGNTIVNQKGTDESNEADVIYEFEMNSEVNGTHKMEEYTKKSKNDKVVYKVENINELPRTIPHAFVQEENVTKVEKVCDSNQPVNGEKQGDDLDAHIDKGDVKKSSTGKESSACGERERKLKPTVNASELEVVHENEDTSKNLECSIDKCGYKGIPELGQTNERSQLFDSETNLEKAKETCMQVEHDIGIMMSHSSFMWEAGQELETSQELNQPENCESIRRKDTLEGNQEEFENKLNATNLSSKQEEDEIPDMIKEAPVFVENESKLKVTQEPINMKQNPEKLKTDREVIGCGENEKIGPVTEVCWQDYNEHTTQESEMKLQQTEEKQNETQVHCELEKSEELTVAVRLNGKNESEDIKEMHVSGDLLKNLKIFQMTVNKDLEDIQEVTLAEKKSNILNFAQNIKRGYQNMLTENITCSVQKIEETEYCRQIEVENEREKEQKLREEKMREKEKKLQAMEREKEREKDKIAVERATREAHERAFVEARERAERIAVERVTAEARQRALAEAWEKAEKSSAEALEKSLAEKASRDARLRAERAAVERATAEARERAVERAIAEKAAASARENAEKLNATSFRDKTRRGNEMEDHFRASDRGNSETRDFTQNMEFRKADASVSSQKHSDSYNQGEGESALRCKARLERHQRTVQRAAKALEEKNMRDILAQREQAERNRLADTLDADVRRWCSGKEGNLRALLSTLQYILGNDSGWQSIPLTEVITAAAVKKAYRRATLCVHPDKLQQRGASIQQKYTCEKVFDLLKDAWNRFNSEER